MEPRRPARLPAVGSDNAIVDIRERLAEVNRLALWDFDCARIDTSTARIRGSNDFAYYHDLEIDLAGVEFSDVPERFSHAEFRLGQDAGETMTLWIVAESQEYEIRAASIVIRIAKVFYYER